MGETHRLKVETLIKKWQDAEKRYNVLKSSDGDQAASSMAGEYQVFFWGGGGGRWRGYMNIDFYGKGIKENRVVEDDFDEARL